MTYRAKTRKAKRTTSDNASDNSWCNGVNIRMNALKEEDQEDESENICSLTRLMRASSPLKEPDTRTNNHELGMLKSAAFSSQPSFEPERDESVKSTNSDDDYTFNDSETCMSTQSEARDDFSNPIDQSPVSIQNFDEEQKNSGRRRSVRVKTPADFQGQNEHLADFKKRYSLSYNSPTGQVSIKGQKGNSKGSSLLKPKGTQG